jgi:flagellin-like protein
MFENFMLSLEIMWKGMSGIFTVIILIMLIVMLMTYLANKKKD